MANSEAIPLSVMQFIPDGPDIPDKLLETHEEGRVVFFCGAGISYPAGLPGFKQLVEQIYQINDAEQNAIEQEAFGQNQFDTTLELLERRLPGQRSAIHRALAQALTPDFQHTEATSVHESLLTLSRNRKGKLRLVTTNFDRVFDTAAERAEQVFPIHTAPTLPIPKNSRWHGLVYLHGQLSEADNETAFKRLVLTSGDFGLAYLTERWAARFVSELFRNYVVCFIGYSINDPVLRYMMDALAADRRWGESTPQAWALCDSQLGEEHQKTREWQAKGVTPILYKVPADNPDHSLLHRTLKTWAETYRDGVTGKEQIVIDYAVAKPSASTQQDNFVGRMLWAISDQSGLPAKRFADFDPAPPLEWLLEAFSSPCYYQSDLRRFGVTPHGEVDENFQFSLIQRPAPYNRTPPMTLAATSKPDTQWDSVMAHLGRWLTRHLNDPRLVIWIAERGGQLHEQWSQLIERELDRFTNLERNEKAAELYAIRKASPNAIPCPQMHTIWRILLAGLVKSPLHDSDLFIWKDRFKRDGLTTTIRFELRRLLAPKVILRKPFPQVDATNEDDEQSTYPRQPVSWELTLTANHVHSALRDISVDNWQPAQPLLLEDYQRLLQDALDLMAELGGADTHNDLSYLHLPSIEPHWQNRGFHDWTMLIELLRDAWLVVLGTDSTCATRIAQNWFAAPYPTFKRLALFAASHDEGIASNQWVEWLLEDQAWWLWSTNLHRETMRLFVTQGMQLSGTSKHSLEEAILQGPPREKYPDDIDEERWQLHQQWAIWLRLAKLSASGLSLGSATSEKYTALTNANPQWVFESHEREEFTHWMSGTGDPDYEENKDVDIAPHKRKGLVEWLRKPIPDNWFFYESTWRYVCKKHPLNSLYALSDLAQEDEWPRQRWREALQTWGEDGLAKRTWRYASPLVEQMPDSQLQELAQSVSCWLQAPSKHELQDESIFLKLCCRILDLPLDADTGMKSDNGPINQPVMEAINHPVGHVTDALINLWSKRRPNDRDQLPDDIKPFFSRLCNTQVDRFRHGRVLLGSRLIALFRVDRPWTEEYLLRLFDWSANPVEARAVWEGFLWSPRLYQPLLVAIKDPFLEAAHHYADLGEHKEQFATFLTYAALGLPEGFSYAEFRSALGAFPQEGLENSARALAQAMEGAGDQRDNYWRNRIYPFWQNVWPKSLEVATPRIAELVAQICIAARAAFPEALVAVHDWLQPIRHPSYVIHQLRESELCSQFPNDSLQLLNAVINDPPLLPNELRQCLDQIVQAAPELEEDPNYRRLHGHARRGGS